MGHFKGVDYATITAQNTANYQALRKRTDTIAIHYVGIRDIVLVGDGHDPRMVAWVTGADGHNDGMIYRQENDTLVVTGCAHAKAEMEAEIRKFSDRKIVQVA